VTGLTTPAAGTSASGTIVPRAFHLSRRGTGPSGDFVLLSGLMYLPRGELDPYSADRSSRSTGTRRLPVDRSNRPDRSSRATSTGRSSTSAKWPGCQRPPALIGWESFRWSLLSGPNRRPPLHRFDQTAVTPGRSAGNVAAADRSVLLLSAVVDVSWDVRLPLDANYGGAVAEVSPADQRAVAEVSSANAGQQGPSANRRGS
jgi:hypothetical protein